MKSSSAKKSSRKNTCEILRNRGNLAQVDGGALSWGDWNSLKFNGENIDSNHPLGKASTFANNPYLTGVIKSYTDAGKKRQCYNTMLIARFDNLKIDTGVVPVTVP